MKNTIEVISPIQVNVNGVHAGRVCDVLSNYKDDIADIQAGLEAHEAELVKKYKNELLVATDATSNATARAKAAEEELAVLKADHKDTKELAAELHRKLTLPERERQAEELQAQADQFAARAAELRK